MIIDAYFFQMQEVQQLPYSLPPACVSQVEYVRDYYFSNFYSLLIFTQLLFFPYQI